MPTCLPEGKHLILLTCRKNNYTYYFQDVTTRHTLGTSKFGLGIGRYEDTLTVTGGSANTIQFYKQCYTKKICLPRSIFTWQESLIQHYFQGFVGLLRDKLNLQHLVVLEFALAKNRHFSCIHYCPR